MKRAVRGLGMAVVSALMVATPVMAGMMGSDAYDFLKAVKDRDGTKVTELLDKNPGTIALTRDDHGDNALHITTKRRDTGWMQFMLSKGVPVDSRDGAGNTALLDAAQIGFLDGEELLIQLGANPNLSNSKGETPLILATQAHDGDSVRLLLQHGADPTEADHVAGMSAIDYAQRDPRSAQILTLLKSVKPVAHKDIAGPSIN